MELLYKKKKFLEALIWLKNSKAFCYFQPKKFHCNLKLISLNSQSENGNFEDNNGNNNNEEAFNNNNDFNAVDNNIQPQSEVRPPVMLQVSSQSQESTEVNQVSSTIDENIPTSSTKEETIDSCDVVINLDSD